MALLAYCIADAAPLSQAEAALQIPSGAEGAAIRLLTEAGLACLISDWAPAMRSSDGKAESAAQSAAELENAALAFHRVVQAVFSRTAVIPVRFPTLFAAESDVIELLREKATEYGRALARLQGRAQLDLRISMQAPNTVAGGPAANAVAKQSGAEYLRRKQADQKLLSAAAESLRQAARPWIEDWRERPQADGLRCFALAQCGSMPEMARALEAVRIPAGVLARVTGPWPASEFVNEKPEERPPCAAARTL